MKKKNNTPKRGSGRKRLSQNRRKALSRFEHLETRTLLAADLNTWHNSDIAADVNADGQVNELDQTILIAELNATGNRYLGAPVTTGILEGEQSLFLDVDNDNSFSPIDLLQVSDTLILEAEAAATYRAEYTFEILNEAGLPISLTPTGDPFDVYTVGANDVFTLVAYVQDTSVVSLPLPSAAAPTGVITAYLDVGITHTNPYTINDNSLIVGTDTSEDGFDDGFALFEENILPGDTNGFGMPDQLLGMGGNAVFTSLIPPVLNADPTEKVQLFSLQFTAGDMGEILFTGREADSSPAVNAAALPAGADPALNLFNTITFESGEELMSSALSSAPIVKVLITQTPVPFVINALSDVYNVSEDLDPVSVTPPTTIHNGERYVVLDVKVNDTKPDGSPLTVDADVLTPDRIESVLFPTVNVLPGNLLDLDSRVIFTSGNRADFSDAQNLALSDNYFLYKAPTNFAGSETFSYTLRDPNDANNIDSGTVTINIASVDDLPVAIDDGILDLDYPLSPVITIFAEPGEQIIIDVLANDFLQGGPDEIEELVLVEARSTGVLGDANADIGVRAQAINGLVYYTAPDNPRTEIFEYVISDRINSTPGEQVTARVQVKTLANTSASGGFFFDVNGDGIWNDNAGNEASPEQFIGGVTVTITGGPGDDIVATSNADGSFNFAQFDPGSYTATYSHPDFVLPTTSPASFTVDALLSDSHVDVPLVGFRGRTYQYRGFSDYIASDTENSIMFAVNKTNGVVDLNTDGSTSVNWYSVDEGWEQLISVDSLIYDAETDSGLVLMTLSGDNTGDPNQQVSLGFSTSTNGFQLVAETPEGIVFRLNGNANTVLKDALFATL
ncbi:MAG: dockerin type I domain-containing protein [Pirellulales bacterium]